MIQYLLFDLDNTLYSAKYGLEDNVFKRMTEFVSAYLGVPPEEAKRRRTATIDRYGTTLEWLRAEQGFTDIEAYYAAIHPEGEADALPADPRLRAFLADLPADRAILTNAPREHADRVLGRLGVADMFTRIFDIRWNQFRGKPAASAFRRALDALGANPETALFIDDTPRCVTGYRALGGTGLLLDEYGNHPDYPPPRIQSLPELTSFH
ncbi:MAG: HAD-IA family hydrolase [Spirochaetaceae bacterium]|jgi:putative hydrolase of the HAD superfamily|nr:HAD-IA family hydrolase [Spirochaetaceae bacterium]